MNTAEHFAKHGFVVLNKLVPEDDVNRLLEYTLQMADKGNKDDGQVPGSPSFYQDTEVVKLQKQLLPQIEDKLQVKLLPVFCYNRIYRTGAILRMHKDSARAEISATINIGQQGAPWDLWLVDYDENTHKVSLTPGDTLIYYGNRLYHWRGKLENTDFVSQVMFHFVDKNGKNAMAAHTEVVRKIRKRCRQLFGLAY
jgi:hypothetical protein